MTWCLSDANENSRSEVYGRLSKWKKMVLLPVILIVTALTVGCFSKPTEGSDGDLDLKMVHVVSKTFNLKEKRKCLPIN